MSLRKGYTPLTVVLGVALALIFAVPCFALSPTIEPAGSAGVYGFYWQPSTAQISVGGVVSFQNPSATTKHGVVWTSGPEPSCPGVPIDMGAIEWKGTCTFTHPGIYSFHCYVHPTEMTGAITVVGTPTATTGSAGEVLQTSTTLNGVVDPEGEATSYYFEYGTTSSFGQKLPATAQGVGSDFSEHHLSASLKGLLPETEYHMQLVASYGASSTVLGGEKVFTTPAVAAPLVSTGQAAAVTQSGATLAGIVSPEGQKTTYHFEYGLSTNYESLTPIEMTGPEGIDHDTSAVVSELLPGTVYHFKLVAENASGPVEGEDKTFTTASPPLPLPTTPTTTATTTSVTPPPASTVPVTPPPPAPPAAPPSGPSLVGGSLKLTVPHHGSSLHGSIQVTQTGAGGRLEVDLLAKGSTLSKGAGSKPVQVGRFLRQSVSSGKVSFSISLTALAKRALARHRSLAVTVKVTCTPTRGSVATVTRSVTLRL